jgi:acyl-CoA synthetase (NDP forming)
MSEFDLFFNPRSIAVIGASQDLASISGQPIAHLKAKGFAGEVFAVNPRYEEVAGYRCYPDVVSLPRAPDVGVIAVGAKRVPDVLRELGAKGCRFALILSSGFAEAGEEGAQAQRNITAIARSFGMQVIGPNCQGYMNISEGIHVGFGAPYGLTYPKGHLSLTSQSGAFGNSIVMLASQEGVGFRHYVSTGNESVTTSAGFHERHDRRPRNPGDRRLRGRLSGRAPTAGHRTAGTQCRQACVGLEGRYFRSGGPSGGVAYRQSRGLDGAVSRGVQAERHHRSQGCR